MSSTQDPRAVGGHRRRLGAWLRHSERGSASLEAVMVLPIVITLFFGAVQAAVYYCAQAVALSAAQEGARAAAAENGTAADGIAAATARASSTDVLTGTTVGVNRTDTEVTVTVSGQSLSLIVFWDPDVTQTATRPVERVTG